MSGWISCDDVFERLTRGPFPSDADDSAVATAEFFGRTVLDAAPDDEQIETHLAVCHDCRRLAEALRPATQELRLAVSLRPDSEVRLPVYRGRMPDWSVEAVALGAAGESFASTPNSATYHGVAVRERRRLSPSWRVGLAVALGVVIGALAAGGWFERPGRSARQLAWSVGSVDPSRGIDATDAVLSPLRLQPVCWNPVSNGADDEGAGFAGLRCCTECHFAGSSSARDVDVVRLTRACLACHRQR